MKWKYPNLEVAANARGISKKAIYTKLGITPRSYYNKMCGKSPLAWDEACIIQTVFFPDMSKDVLFADHAREEEQ